MHTMRVVVSENEVYYVTHNGDWSGDVIVYYHSSAAGDKELFRAPFEVLQAIVGQQIIDETISKMQDMLPQNIFRQPMQL